ncbi:serine hydrolase [Lentisphaera marina]|uniref:serine hydrolase domain-containing protein n=1 Tax=Lentisphaera marina TaxID=1111041 RepID=UPI002365D5A2|nr:serine hydrolase [Lentisphaera marina]MDD7985166.1 serine hydrolase [Lentisphaera marina]
MIKQFILLSFVMALGIWADDGLKVANLNSVKCDKKALSQLVVKLKDEEFGKVCSLLIAKGDTLLIEEYFGDANKDKLHPTRSHTKSMTSYVVGKAIEQGKIKSVNDPILKYLPEVDASKLLPGVERITIKDCLSMSAGLRGSKNNKQPKGLKKDELIPWILENWTEKLVTGERRFSYSYSDPIIISHVLYNATGKTIEEMAAKHFFKPMGIKKHKFRTFGNGLTNPIDNMELRSRDLLKLGLLTLNGGVWNGKQLLNKSYIDEATTAHAVVNKNESYGYFWWVNRIKVKGKTYEVKTAFGAGGQMIYVIPEFDMVVVFTAEKADKRKLLALLQDTIVPAFLANK